MSVIPVAVTSSTLTVGEVWRMSAAVTDFDGAASDVVPVVTVSLPGGTTATPVPERVSAGGFVVDYVTTLPGRHVATWSTAYGATAFGAYVIPVVAAAGMPDLDEFKVYAGVDALDVSRDAEIVAAIAAEELAQHARCRVPAAYPADLREALLRRVARNLAMRLLPLAVLRGDGETGSDTILPGQDPEVRRLEAPYRRRKMG